MGQHKGLHFLKKIKEYFILEKKSGIHSVLIKNKEVQKQAIPKEAQLHAMAKRLQECRKCPLGTSRTHMVFGQGACTARLMWVGEAPGADEDAQGLAFVGEAGKQLTAIIKAMSLTREEVYIANVIKCRPPGNRKPSFQEIEACKGNLFAQIEVIKPEVICALGTFAAHTLLATDKPISSLRGTFYQFKGIPVMPTFHPAHLLYHPQDKRCVWEDVQKIMKVLGLPLPKKIKN